jgi:ubiquinone/menaquinone biosynthesis C-methylase UbiE
MNHYFGVHLLDGNWHSLLPRYLVLAERIRGRRVLDLGCGSGIGASLLMELGAERVDGVDPSPASIDLARTKHDKASLHFHCMRWGELDFSDDTFDLALCLDADRPVTDPALLGEIRRVLVPEGEYVCSIERRTVEGLETLLPRQSTARGHTGEQAPQIGELAHHFEAFNRLRQRPTYRYVFEPDASDEDDTSEPPHEDDTLCPDEPADAGVEMLFCGPDDMSPPPRRAVRLPYYRLVERLREIAAARSSSPSNGGTRATNGSLPSVPGDDRLAPLDPETLPDALRHQYQRSEQHVERLQREVRDLSREHEALCRTLLSSLRGRDVQETTRPPPSTDVSNVSEERTHPNPDTSRDHKSTPLGLETASSTPEMGRDEGAVGSTLAEETNEPEDVRDDESLEAPSPSVDAPEPTESSGDEPAADDSEPLDELGPAPSPQTSPPSDEASPNPEEASLQRELARLEDQQQRLQAELEERSSYIDELRERIEAREASDSTDDEMHSDDTLDDDTSDEETEATGTESDDETDAPPEDPETPEPESDDEMNDAAEDSETSGDRETA